MHVRLQLSREARPLIIGTSLGAFALVLLGVGCSVSVDDPVGASGSAASGGTPASSGSGGGSVVTAGSPSTGGSSVGMAGTPASAGQGSGGGNGSAGAAGGSAGGSAGSGSAGTGSGGGGTSAPCPSGTAFCDDFESYVDGMPPSGKWKAWTVGKGTVLIDSKQGSKAAHFHGQVSQSGGSKEQAFMMAQDAPSFPITGTTFYMRFMLYGTRFPFTGVTTANHTVLAWVGSVKALSKPDQGATGEGYMFADYNGVAIEPMWSGYFRDTTKHFKDANQANKWHCWEFEIDNAGGPPPGAGGVALPHIWEDGVELKLSRAGSGDTYTAINFESILFSLWSPQADNAVADYWVDDVVASKSRINCPAAK